MVSIYDFSDYRMYLNKRFEQMPKAGYGQGRRLADHMGVHTSLVSQILKGQKELSPDLTVACADFFGLNALETDYLLALVQLERAGTELLRKATRRRIDEIKKKVADLSQRTTYPKILSDEQRAIFYSSWIYAVIRQLSAIGKGTDLDTLSAQLNLPLTTTKQAVEFLIASGLCVEEKNKIKIGPVRSFLERSSPWARVYHRNWRDRSANSLDQNRETGFHYTSPVTLSIGDAEKIRAMLVETVQQVNQVIDPSPSETLRCLCIDWFDPI